MLSKLLDKYIGLHWFRRCLAIAVLLYTFRLTNWGAQYAMLALGTGADLMGVAAIIGAVAAIPLGLVTLVFNKYNEKRTNDQLD